MKLFLLFVVCLVPLVSSRSTKGRETDACIADYLITQGLLGEEFGSDRPLSPICTSVAQVTKNAIMESVQVRVAQDSDMHNYEACIMDSLKKSNIGNLLLTVYIYETVTDIDATEKAEKEKMIQKDITKATLQAYISCRAETKFGEMFDDLLSDDSSSSEEEEDPKEDYCTRKHVVDNKLIALEGVTLDLNPKSVDLKNIDCHLHYQKALHKAETELVQGLMEDDSKEEQDNDEKFKINASVPTCLLDVVRGGKYIDQMLQYDYIKELNLTPPKMLAMRRNFIATMTRLAQSASQCFL